MAERKQYNIYNFRPDSERVRFTNDDFPGDVTNVRDALVYLNNKANGGTADLSKYQKVEDYSLETIAQKIPDAINEVNTTCRLIPKRTTFENGKLYLIDKNGRKLDNGTILPISNLNLDNYAKKDELPTALSQLFNDKGFITQADVGDQYVTKVELNAKGYLTEHQDLSDYALKTEIPTKPQDIGAEISGTAYNLVSAHNISTTAHNDLRLKLKDLQDELDGLFNSDADTLQKLQELVDFVNNNKDLIDGITIDKVNVDDIVDNLTTTDATKPLSANQGVVLKGMIDNLSKAKSTKLEGNKLFLLDEAGNKLDSGTVLVIPKQDVDLSDYAKKVEIPTNVSQLANDRGYINLIPPEYVTETVLDNKHYATEDKLTEELNKLVIPKATLYEDSKLYLIDDAGNKLDVGTTIVSGGKVDLSEYVKKEVGKGLSTNDYTTPEKEKLAQLENYDDTDVKAIIPRGMLLEDNKFYLVDANGQKLNNGTEIPVADGVDLSAYYTKTDIDGKNFLTEVPPEYIDETELQEYMDQVVTPKLDEYAQKDRTVLTTSLSLGRKPNSDEGLNSIALGNNVEASGNSTLAIGRDTIARGFYSSSQGKNNVSTGEASHTEGFTTKSIGEYSHAEGKETKTVGDISHAEGVETITNGIGSHAEGYGSIANGEYSHAEGYKTIAGSEGQSVRGRYNVQDTAGQYLDIVGCGTGEVDRSNAYTLDKQGNAYYKGVVTADGEATNDYDLTNIKYLKENYYDKAGVKKEIADSNKMEKEVVDVLPDVADAKDNIMYMLKLTDTDGNPYYNIYQKVNNQLVNTSNTKISLSDYYTKTETDEFIGNRNVLTTTIKDNLVDAMNEINSRVGFFGNLSTTDKFSLVTALNEVNNKVGDIDDLTTNNKSSLINAINELNRNINKSSGAPTGTITMYAGAVAPQGYLLCKGQEVSKTQYADLYDVIGDQYGTPVDPDNSFSLPNLCGKVVVGLDANDGTFKSLGKTGGEKAHRLTTGEMPAHSHSAYTTSSGSHSHTISFMTTNKSGKDTLTVLSSSEDRGSTYNKSTNSAGSHTHTVGVYSTGDSYEHNNLQPYTVLNYIIKY